MFKKFLNFFENFKFSNLQQEGNFSIFGSKSLFSARVGSIKFVLWWGRFNFLLGTYNVPSGSSATSLRASAKREFDGVGWGIKSVL